MKTIDVGIIGGGPAGYTAAIYSSRANLSTVQFLGVQPGGQITLTNDLENFPGFPDGIGGLELAENFEKQATKFGTVTVYDKIDAVDFSKRPFYLKTTGGEEYLADSVIISTGSSSRMLGVPGETESIGRGVSTCATCDAFFYRDKHVVVVGGGDSALDESLFLTRFVKKLTLVHRRDKFRGSPILQNRVLKNEKIEVVWNSVVEEVLHNETGVYAARLKNVETGKVDDLPVDGIFVFIGHLPNTSLFKGSIDLDEHDYILTDRNGHTNIPGVFAAGDVQDSIYRQAITAAGSGCMAALEAYKFLEHEKSNAEVSLTP
ncbi:MAG: thioredoxin-disulfide reductase [Bacteroidetes bacterium]|nr:thioredoxin-disulfide reductase [Bacteroidota bacterium]